LATPPRWAGYPTTMGNSRTAGGVLAGAQVPCDGRCADNLTPTTSGKPETACTHWPKRDARSKATEPRPARIPDPGTSEPAADRLSSSCPRGIGRDCTPLPRVPAMDGRTAVDQARDQVPHEGREHPRRRILPAPPGEPRACPACC